MKCFKFNFLTNNNLLFIAVLVLQCFCVRFGVGRWVTTFYLYSRAGSVKLNSDELPSDFDKSKPTFVVLHGWTEGHARGCASKLLEALSETQDANIISSDYFVETLTYTKYYAKVTVDIAQFLLNHGIDPSKTTVLGFSLGAQIAGTLHSYGFKPHSIIALDPAGPFFWFTSEWAKLTPQSADFVQVIHSNAGYLGTKRPAGHLDVYINGGNRIPCCLTSVCKHYASCKWMAETIRKGPQPALICDSLRSARSGYCNGGSINVGFGVTNEGQNVIAYVQLNEC